MSAGRILALVEADVSLWRFAPALLSLEIVSASRLGDHQGAVELSARALERYPNEPGIRRSAGEAYYAARRYKEAVPLLEGIAPDSIHDTDVHDKLFFLHLAASEFDDAWRVINRAIDLFPDPMPRALFLVYRGWWFLRAGKLEEADRDIREAERLDALSIVAPVARAELALARGDMVGVFEQSSRALGGTTFSVASATMPFLLSLAAQFLDREDEALRILARFPAWSPGNAPEPTIAVRALTASIAFKGRAHRHEVHGIRVIGTLNPDALAKIAERFHSAEVALTGMLECQAPAKCLVFVDERGSALAAIGGYETSRDDLERLGVTVGLTAYIRATVGPDGGLTTESNDTIDHEAAHLVIGEALRRDRGFPTVPRLMAPSLNREKGLEEGFCRWWARTRAEDERRGAASREGPAESAPRGSSLERGSVQTLAKLLEGYDPERRGIGARGSVVDSFHLSLLWEQLAMEHGKGIMARVLRAMSSGKSWREGIEEATRRTWTEVEQDFDRYARGRVERLPR